MSKYILATHGIHLQMRPTETFVLRTSMKLMYAQKNGLAMEEVVSNIFTPQPIGIQPKTTAYNIK